ncbi:MAG: cytochrome c biogenesis protein ResB, partial [Bacillota bacterium]
LRRKGYRTFNESRDGTTYIAADRGRWGILGPYLSHISFIIMIVAILFKFSGLVGFEGDLITVVGKTHNLGEVSKLKNVTLDEYFDIRLDNFRTVYNNNDPNQGIKDWYSDVTVIDKNKNQTYPFTIEVNRPLVHNNIKFYQMSYGFYFAGKVSSASGGSNNFELMTNTGNSYTQAPGTDIYFVPDAINPYTKKIDVHIYKGNQEAATQQAELGKPLTYETAAIEFTDARDYSLFSVKRDPTVPYMGFASILLIVAVTYSFLVKHRLVWAVVEERDGNADIRMGGLSQKHKADFQKDFETIVNELKGEKGGAERGLR